MRRITAEWTAALSVTSEGSTPLPKAADSAESINCDDVFQCLVDKGSYGGLEMPK